MSKAAKPLDVLVLYNATSVGTSFVEQHLSAIRRHSRHNVFYAPATFDRRADYPLELFDALIIHFSVRLPWSGVLSGDFASKVADFKGPKILMIQDEYDLPEHTCSAIRRLGIGFVFTTVPEEYRDAFYPLSAVPGVTFKQCLTGYIPDVLPAVEDLRPIAVRPLWIGYRGRQLPVWYGSLAREKHEIGEKMKTICEARAIPHDIEWSEEKRIQGAAWFDFLASSRVTLGTESGSNVVDKDGSIRRRAQKAMVQNPRVSEQEIYRQHVEPFDNHVKMNQLSPKIFEAIAMKTGLVLFEGEHSGVIEPGRHYISLRKDFANIEDVLARISDAHGVQDMTERAYADIIGSGRYGYDKFIASVDTALEGLITSEPSSKRWVWAAIQVTGNTDKWSADVPHLPLSRPIATSATITTETVLKGRARSVWLQVPSSIRSPLIKLLGPAARTLAKRRKKAKSN